MDILPILRGMPMKSEWGKSRLADFLAYVTENHDYVLVDYLVDSLLTEAGDDY